MATAENWQQVQSLFHAALELTPGDRSVFLVEACSGDESLRREIESLILAHEEQEHFIDSPAYVAAAEMLTDVQEFKPGQSLNHYEIHSELGEGGMGQVYLAMDTILGRQVALKVLPQRFTIDPERVRRFEQEARAASALNHPNIVTIHEIGRFNSAQFIVTEFIAGQTLRELMNEKPFTLNEALNVAIQIAGALTTAHAAGIVHRDIKPENIMLRTDGYVKILDFGLAKLTEPPAESELETSTLLQSNPGLVMGTVQYMSPEQARGKTVDARTDIWSLGVVLYELLSGRVPFSGETPSHVMVSLMENELPPLTDCANVPAELDRIVSKALRKNKKERYQNAKDLAHDLKNLKHGLQVEAHLQGSLEAVPSHKEIAAKSDEPKAAPSRAARTVANEVAHPTSSAEYLVSEIKRHRLAATFVAAVVIAAVATIGYFYRFRSANVAGSAGPIDSVAVLPFVNVNKDPNTEYLSDGISDSIIDRLSRVSALRVISFNSVLRYKGKAAEPQDVGKAMNVRAVLMGRLTQRGDDLQITVELVDARDNRRLWGEQYNRKFADIIVVQDEIARQIAKSLRPRLTGEEQKQLAKRYTDNTQAYQLYTLGMYHSRKETREDLYKSIEFFEQAMKIDPNYTLAYIGLFRTYAVLGQRGFWFPKEAQQKAEWAALKAVEIDDTDANAHACLGLVKSGNWDWAGAEKEFKHALELDPNQWGAVWLYSIYLMHVERMDEALIYAKRADELAEPGAPRATEAFAYLYAHEFDKAIELYLRAGPNRPWNFQLVEAYLGKGMYEEAIAEEQKVVARDNAPEKWSGYPLLAYAYAMAGRRDEALKVLDEQKRLAKRGYISPFNFAVIYTGLGDKDRAFEYLNKAYEEGSQMMPHFPRRPMFDSLHSDPRYRDLLRRMNLADILKS